MNTMKSLRGIFSCIAALWLAGCEAPGTTGGPAVLRGIVNGVEDSDPAHGGIAMSYADPVGTMCTGVLFAPRLVALPAFCIPASGNFYILFGQDVISAPEATIDVAESIIHPDYDSDDYTSPMVAVAVLSEDAPAGIEPIPLLPEDEAITAADIGTNVTFVGYGSTDPYNVVGTGVRRVADAPISQVTPSSNEFTVDSSAAGPCRGDSPGLVMRGGTEYVAGLTILGTEDCTLATVAMVTAYMDFFDEVVATHGGGADGGLDAGGEEDGGTVVDAGGDADADSDADGDADSDADTDGDADAGADSGASADDSSGCDCGVVPAGFSPSGAMAIAAALLALLARRTRPRS